MKKILKKISKHFAKMGTTNRLGMYIMLFLASGLVGGFYLANKSIAYGYTGPLLCWTAIFTPIGTAVSIVLNSIVKKSAMENSGADGEGIKFASAKAKGFIEFGEDSINSPEI